jgi:NTP pyrophosphatase (non-canonical NTP hydrolase)
MTILKENSTLADYQQYVKKICAERGWDKANTLQTWLLFTEEVGELAKAIRDTNGLFQETDKANVRENLEGEFADVLSYIFDLANQMNVDLEQAFRNKEKINAARSWTEIEE